MQGPVGFRCKTCGTLANDPLSTIRPLQGLLGLAISFGLGLVAAFIAGRIGFFAIIVSFIGGGFIAEAVTRVIGWKRGTSMLVIVLGGIVAGHVAGFGVDYLLTWSGAAGIPVEEGGVPFSFILTNFMWAAVSAGSCCVGAYSRLR
jgi:ABC-type amino acid transport system permease subunit